MVTNASAALCAPRKTCLNIAVTIRSRLSDPVPFSDLTAWQRLNESESVTIGRRKESTSTVLGQREVSSEQRVTFSAGTDRSQCASSTASDTEHASAARVLRTTRLVVLLVQCTRCPSWNSPCQKRRGFTRQKHDDTALALRTFHVWQTRHLHTSPTGPSRRERQNTARAPVRKRPQAASS